MYLARVAPPFLARHVWLRRSMVTVMAVLLLNLTLARVVGVSRLMGQPNVVSYGTTEPELFVSPAGIDLGAELNEFVKTVHAEFGPDDTFFVYNGAARLYLLTGRTNPTRYQSVMALYNTRAQIDEVTRDLERKKPRWIVYNQLDSIFFRFDDRFTALRHYDYHLRGIEGLLARAYRLKAIWGDMMVYERVN